MIAGTFCITTRRVILADVVIVMMAFTPSALRQQLLQQCAISLVEDDDVMLDWRDARVHNWPAARLLYHTKLYPPCQRLNVITIKVSKMTCHCAGTVQKREESENGIRKWEKMWFETTTEDGERVLTVRLCISKTLTLKKFAKNSFINLAYWYLHHLTGTRYESKVIQ